MKFFVFPTESAVDPRESSGSLAGPFDRLFTVASAVVPVQPRRPPPAVVLMQLVRCHDEEKNKEDGSDRDSKRP